MSPQPVTVEITADKVGTAHISPYNKAQGLEPGVVYVVPTYRIKVGTKSFEGVRFGLERNNASPPPNPRTCDTGLQLAQEKKPGWVPGYSPHSFPGGGRKGAWRIYPDKDFLIHEGPPTLASIGGSLGCIEVVGPGQWNAFLKAIEDEAAAPAEEIGAAHALTVKIAAATFPSVSLET